MYMLLTIDGEALDHAYTEEEIIQAKGDYIEDKPKYFNLNMANDEYINKLLEYKMIKEIDNKRYYVDKQNVIHNLFDYTKILLDKMYLNDHASDGSTSSNEIVVDSYNYYDFDDNHVYQLKILESGDVELEEINGNECTIIDIQQFIFNLQRRSR